MKSFALMLLFVASCHTSFNGVDDGLHLEITLSKSTYQVGEPVQIHIANRSTVPVFVMHSCPPAVEELASDAWTSVHLDMICTADAPPPVELAPGASIDATIPTQVDAEALLDPGTYRGSFKIAGPDQLFAWQYSPGFDIEGGAHD